MAQFLVVLALSIFSAQCAVLRSYDTPLKRVARCDECQHNHYGPPPPPPPRIYHAQHWTGFLQGPDGGPRGVFSGAAASAQASDENQASGQAYVLSNDRNSQAMQQSGSQAGAFTGSQAGHHSGSQAGSNNGASQVPQSFGSQSGANAKVSQLPQSFGSQSGANAGASQVPQSFGSHAGANAGSSQVPQSFGNHAGANGGISQGLHPSGSQEGFNTGASQSLHHSGSEANSGAGLNAVGNPGGYGSSRQSYDHGGSFDQSGQITQQTESQRNFGSGSRYNTQYDRYNSAQKTAQSSLQGALDLAAQGQQASAGGGCSTCGKSNYALSNAKSHSGNAIAISNSGK